jgi:hypothetical protein
MQTANYVHQYHSSAMALCQFRNVSGRMVILRCVGPEAFFQEKVIFPFEEWQWSCPPGSRVDIWSYSLMGADLVESFQAEVVAISCDLPAAEDSPEALQDRHRRPGGSMNSLEAIPVLAA